MKNPDLSDFKHAVVFYAISVIFAGLSAFLQTWGRDLGTFAAILANGYAVGFLALLSVCGFGLGSISAYAGILSLKGGSK